MSDVNLMTPQLVSGAAILLSFFAGYKYALRVMRSTESPIGAEAVQSTSAAASVAEPMVCGRADGAHAVVHAF